MSIPAYDLEIDPNQVTFINLYFEQEVPNELITLISSHIEPLYKGRWLPLDHFKEDIKRCINEYLNDLIGNGDLWHDFPFNRWRLSMSMTSNAHNLKKEVVKPVVPPLTRKNAPWA